jgi:23S rRNA pseudouridine2605 synthase
MPAERLQKIMAAAGVASRRKAEELITAGLVSVNGQTVTELGTKADPEVDNIKVNGKPLAGAERHVYLLLHKPKGYVTTVTDPEGRPTVMDLVRGVGARIYPVGRLDYLSEGRLQLTNDGALAQKLTRASSHVPKTYVVKISGKPAEAQIEKLRGGMFLPADRTPLKTREGQLDAKASPRRSKAVRTGPMRIKLVREGANPWYEITLIEGRNRQIRRMFEQIGHHVEKIRRVRYGPLELDVEPGEFRHLALQEVARLKSAMRGANRSSDSKNSRDTKDSRPAPQRPHRAKKKKRES